MLLFLRGPEVECQSQLPINLLVPSFSLLAVCRVINVCWWFSARYDTLYGKGHNNVVDTEGDVAGMLSPFVPITYRLLEFTMANKLGNLSTPYHLLMDSAKYMIGISRIVSSAMKLGWLLTLRCSRMGVGIGVAPSVVGIEEFVVYGPSGENQSVWLSKGRVSLPTRPLT